MVGASGRKHRKIKRKNSWKDTLRGLTTTSGSEKEESTSINPQRPGMIRRSTSGLKSPHIRRNFLRAPEENKNDAHPSDDEEDYTNRREEDRPLQARVKYVYPHSTPAAAWIEAAAEKQDELSAALLEADSKASRATSGQESSEQKKEPIGVRLTMTSRTGYFQDRIISPSMVCQVLLSRASGISLSPLRCVLWPSCTSDLIETLLLRATIACHQFSLRITSLLSSHPCSCNAERKIPSSVRKISASTLFSLNLSVILQTILSSLLDV